MTQRVFSAEADLIVAAVYVAGESSGVIARRLGCSEPAVVGAMRRCGVSPRVKRLFDDRIPEIVAAYLEGQTAKAIGAAHGSSEMPILRILRQHVPIRTGGPQPSPCDRRYFQNIDTEAKAYWLGMLATDGYVNYKRKSVELGLKASDRSHIEKLRTALGATVPVRDYFNSLGGRWNARLTIASKDMVADLAQWGIVQRKSKTIAPPSLRSDLMRHFWRGAIDGDGSLGYYSNKWSLHYIGSCAMVTGFRDFMVAACGTTSAIRRHFKSYCIRIGGNRMAVSAMDSVYANATVYLDRKFALYQRAKARA